MNSRKNRYILIVGIVIILSVTILSPPFEEEVGNVDISGEIDGLLRKIGELDRIVGIVELEIYGHVMNKGKVVQSMKKGFYSDGAALRRLEGIILVKRILLDAIGEKKKKHIAAIVALEKKSGIVSDDPPVTQWDELKVVFSLNETYELGLSEKNLELVMYGEGIDWPKNLAEFIDPNTWLYIVK